MTYQFSSVVSFTSLRYNIRQFWYVSVLFFLAYIRYDKLILFVSTGKTDVLKRIEKNLLHFYPFMSPFHWQALSVDVSTILIVVRDRLLPKRVVKKSSRTIGVITSMQKRMAEKRWNFCVFKNSTCNCVYHKHCGCEASPSLRAVFNVVFGSIDFVGVIFDIHCRKRRFSASSQLFLAKNSIFGRFEVVFFLRVAFFQGAAGYILLVNL